MNLYKVLIALFVLSFSLFARDITLQSILQIKQEKRITSQRVDVYRLSNKKIQENFVFKRKLPQGSATVLCKLSLPSSYCGVYLVDSYGVVVDQQSNDGKTAVVFQNVWPGTYTIVAEGKGDVNGIHSRLKGVHGSTDTTFISAEYKDVVADQETWFEKITVQDFPIEENGGVLDTLVIKGKATFDGENASNSFKSSLIYAIDDFREKERMDISFNSAGEFEATLLCSGDSLMAKWEGFDYGAHSYASCWLDGNSINASCESVDISQTDTLHLNLDFKKAVRVVGKVTADLENKDSIFLARIGLVSEDGRYIASDFINYQETSKNEYSLNYIPDGEYYLVVDASTSGMKQCFYPNTHNVNEASKITLNSDSNNSFDINLGRINDYDKFHKTILPLKIKVIDKDGDLVKPSDYLLKPYGQFSNIKYFNILDSVISIAYTGLDSIRIAVEHRTNKYIGRSWYGGNALDDAKYLLPRSFDDTLEVVITLQESGTLTGRIVDSVGNKIDSLKMSKHDNITGSVNSNFSHSVFINEFCFNCYLGYSNGYTLNGVPSKKHSQVSILPHTEIFDNKYWGENISMYKGGRYTIDTDVATKTTSNIDIIAPIVSGRIDIQTYIDETRDPYHLLALVNKEGDVVSYCEANSSLDINEISKEAEFLGANSQIWEANSKQYNSYVTGSLFGIGKGEYYLIAFTFEKNGEDFYFSWFGIDDEINGSYGDHFTFPYAKLEIPKGAKTISFETDSTWIKDFDWDITPVTNMKTVTKSQFQVQQLGQKLQLQLPIEMNNVTAKILTPSGRLVKSVSIENSGLHSISISDVSKGVYFLKVESETQKFSEKVTIR